MVGIIDEHTIKILKFQHGKFYDTVRLVRYYKRHVTFQRGQVALFAW